MYSQVLHKEEEMTLVTDVLGIFLTVFAARHLNERFGLKTTTAIACFIAGAILFILL